MGEYDITSTQFARLGKLITEHKLSVEIVGGNVIQ